MGLACHSDRWINAIHEGFAWSDPVQKHGAAIFFFQDTLKLTEIAGIQQ